MSAYLVRTMDNRILGPFSKEQVTEHILQGVLKPRDEVSPATEYWFYVQEREETLKFLGIEMPIHRDPEEDETQTETITATNPAEVLRAAEVSAAHAAAGTIGPITDLAPSPLEALTAVARTKVDEPEVKIEFPFYFKLSVWMVLAILAWMGFQIYRQIHPDYSYPKVVLPSPASSASSVPVPSVSPTARPSASPHVRAAVIPSIPTSAPTLTPSAPPTSVPAEAQ